MYQDEFRYILLCTHAIPHVAHTKLCVFSFPKNDTSSNDTGSCNFLDRCSDAKCPYVHYVLDDPRANEESALYTGGFAGIRAGESVRWRRR